jgi:hypothetical protein
MGYSTSPMADLNWAKTVSRMWGVVAASSLVYFKGRKYWSKYVVKADLKDDHNTIFFTLKNGDFVTVERFK